MKTSIRALCVLAALSVTSLVNGSPALAEPSPPPEVTAVDITTIKDFRADRATVFGVSLGMSRASVEQLMAKQPKLKPVPDEHNPARIYVHEPGVATDDTILYFIWEPGDDRLSTITFFKAFAGHLIGNTKALLTNAAVPPLTGHLKSFLGAADRTATTLDVPSIQLKHTTYYHDARRINVTDEVYGNERGVVFAFTRAK